jgi:hypothetical protein
VLFFFFVFAEVESTDVSDDVDNRRARSLTGDSWRGDVVLVAVGSAGVRAPFGANIPDPPLLDESFEEETRAVDTLLESPRFGDFSFSAFAGLSPVGAAGVASNLLLRNAMSPPLEELVLRCGEGAAVRTLFVEADAFKPPLGTALMVACFGALSNLTVVGKDVCGSGFDALRDEPRLLGEDLLPFSDSGSAVFFLSAPNTPLKKAAAP